MTHRIRPWAALWTLILGFFMILVDSTIVSVATPTILRELHTSTAGVVWVTSAYLLAYVIPLLLAGRLGDRFGQKPVYLIGLATFTMASLACGFSGTLGVLVLARVVQGLGASLMTPQTLAVVMRVFPPERRGPALAAWGTVGGGAAVVGPLVGGALVSAWGWPWIFWINVPIGVIGFALAIGLVPRLPTSARSLDLWGLVMSSIGLGAVVYGLQQSDARWLIPIGVVVLALFVLIERRTTRDPLLPMALFAHRDFALSSVALAAMSFAVTCLAIPFMLYAQDVLALTALQSSLLLLPMAVAMLALAPLVGRLLALVRPRWLCAGGFLVTALAMLWLAALLRPHQDPWQLLIPSALLGVGSSFVAAPLSAAAIRRLPAELAGAGSGAFSAFRQLGAVLGSACIAAVVPALLSIRFPHGIETATPSAATTGYAQILAASLLLPAAALVVGLLASLCLAGVSESTLKARLPATAQQPS
jgi:EmrB/QacA subfamily drug resistance transporter